MSVNRASRTVGSTDLSTGTERLIDLQYPPPRHAPYVPTNHPCHPHSLGLVRANSPPTTLLVALGWVHAPHARPRRRHGAARVRNLAARLAHRALLDDPHQGLLFSPGTLSRVHKSRNAAASQLLTSEPCSLFVQPRLQTCSTPSPPAPLLSLSLTHTHALFFTPRPRAIRFCKDFLTYYTGAAPGAIAHTATAAAQASFPDYPALAAPMPRLPVLHAPAATAVATSAAGAVAPPPSPHRRPHHRPSPHASSSAAAAGSPLGSATPLNSVTPLATEGSVLRAVHECVITLDISRHRLRAALVKTLLTHPTYRIPILHMTS